MQAVDRHDKLCSIFPLTDRHGMKKYYTKIAFSLIDIALTNAWIHYKLVHNPKEENARYLFMDSIGEEMITQNWNEVTSEAKATEKNFQMLCQKMMT